MMQVDAEGKQINQLTQVVSWCGIEFVYFFLFFIFFNNQRD